MQNPEAKQRSFIKNFFVKKDLQIRITLEIVVAVFITAVITTAIIAVVYYFKSGSGYFYFMSNSLTDDIVTQSILKTILPSLLIAEIISIVLGVGIGLFSSRRLAVPLFRIEQWLAEIIQGKYGTRITFREKEEFKKLSLQCNLVSNSLVNMFNLLYEEIGKAETSAVSREEKEKFTRIKKMLPDLNPPSD